MHWLGKQFLDRMGKWIYGEYFQNCFCIAVFKTKQQCTQRCFWSTNTSACFTSFLNMRWLYFSLHSSEVRWIDDKKCFAGWTPETLKLVFPDNSKKFLLPNDFRNSISNNKCQLRDYFKITTKHIKSQIFLYSLPFFVLRIKSTCPVLFFY